MYIHLMFSWLNSKTQSVSSYIVGKIWLVAMMLGISSRQWLVGSMTYMVLLTLPSRSSPSPRLRGASKMTSLEHCSALVSGTGMIKSIVTYIRRMIFTDLVWFPSIHSSICLGHPDYTVTALSFPNFLYVGNHSNPQDPEAGLFHSLLLMKVSI